MACALLLTTSATLVADEATDQFSVATDHYSHQRWQLAAEEFKTFLRDFPEHRRAIDTSFYLGETLAQLERFTEAREHYQRFETQAPSSKYARQATFRAAEMLYRSGQYEKAKSELRSFDKSRRDDIFGAFALVYRGTISIHDNDSESAETIYREALQRFPNGPLNSEIRFGLAEALELNGDRAEAIRLFRFLAESSTASLRDAACLRAGRLLHLEGQHTEVVAMLDAFDNSFVDSPLRIRAKYWLGISQLELNQPNLADHALTLPQELGADEPLAADFEYGRARVANALGDSTGALAHYKRVHTAWPDSGWADDAIAAIGELAEERSDAERLAECVALLHEQYPSSPHVASVTVLAGQLALRQNRFNDAVLLFESLVPEDFGDHATLHCASQCCLGVAYLGAEKPDNALAALTTIAPVGTHSEWRDRIAVATAKALMELRRYEEAIVPLQAYLRSQPDGRDAATCRSKLAYCFLEAGDMQASQAAFAEFREHERGTELFFQTTVFLAEHYVAQGSTSFGRNLFESLTVGGVPEKFALQGLAGLGKLQLAAGDVDDSATTFGRLLELAPQAEQAADAALRRAQSLEQAGKIDAALDAFRLVFDDYGQSAAAAIALADAAKLQEQRGHDREARDLYIRLLARPSSTRRDAVLYQLAWVLAVLGQPAEDDDTFAKIFSEHSDSEYWADATYRLAERAFQNGEPDAAALYVKRLLDGTLEPRLLGHTLYLQGQLAAQQEKWEEVIAPMRRLVDEIPASGLRLPARYWIAESTYRLAAYEDAEKQFASLTKELGARETTWAPMLPLRQAQSLAHQGQWAESLQIATQVSARYPKFRQLYEADYVAGRCLSMQARFSAARDAFNRVVRSTTGGRTETAAMAQWMIGESFLHQKHYRDAIRAYHRVVSLHPYPHWQAAALLQAGKCHELSGERREAVKLYTQLLREYPDTEYAADASLQLRIASRNVNTKTN